MIRSFRHKGLERFWNEGDPQGVRGDLRKRVQRRLTALDTAQDLRELFAVPGWGFHRLEGKQSARFAIDVNGPWRITFEWDNGDAVRVDLEQYH